MDQVIRRKIQAAMHRNDWQEVENLEALENRRDRLKEAKLFANSDELRASRTPQEKREIKFQREYQKRHKGRLSVNPCGLGL